jgi:hypothetical protein
MRQDVASSPSILEQSAGKSRLLSRLYREIGLAAVATELQLDLAEALAPRPEDPSTDAPRLTRGELAA